MAKHKKSHSKYVSKGERHSVSKKLTNAMRSAYLLTGKRVLNQYTAFLEGKNVVLTIENPNKNETNKRFIKVNANEVWKLPSKPSTKY